MSFFSELQRRNVFRVGIAYAVSAWVVLQVADLVLDNVEAPGWVMDVFMLVVALGFIAALVVAWAYELTPEGVKRESEVVREQSITHHTAKKLDKITLAAIAVLILFLLADRFLLRDAVEAPAADGPADTAAAVQAPPSQAESAPSAIGKSIAVLPFVNMSPDRENEYFSDGIAEEILNVLVRIPELKVAARTSAFAYKGTNINVVDIARELKVENILEGSVRKAGNRVRITAQLIKADDGFHLWSGTFDRELTNIFAIQDEIAGAIADALKVTLELQSGAAGNLTGTTSTGAYDAYLRGMNQWHLRTGESLENSIRLFEQAISIDPQFAKAHAGLALAYAVIMDYTDYPEDDARARVRVTAERALAIDPQSIEAATALIYGTSKLDQQLAYAERAIALNPSFATTHQWYGTTLAVTGDLEAAENAYLRALELDPRSRVIHANLAYLYMIMARFEQAKDVLEDLLSWAPSLAFAQQMLFVTELARKDFAAAEQVGRMLVRTLDRTEDNVAAYLQLFDTGTGGQAAAKILGWPEMDFWAPENPRVIGDDYLLPVLALSGHYDSARQLLERLIETTPVYVYGYLRADRSIPEFLCQPETQALYEATDLPPLKVPYPCDELLP